MEDINFQAIVLILFLVVSAIKAVGERFRGRAREQTPQPDSDSSNSLEDIYEQYREQIRSRQGRGQSRRQRQQKRQEEPALASPPPIPQAPIQQTPIPQAPIRKSFSPQKVTLTKEQKQAAQKFEQLSKKDKRKQKNSDAHASLRGLLTSPASAKQAVILTEILGKPKSMQKSSYGY